MSRKLNLPSTERSVPIALMHAREGVMAPIRDMLAGTGITEQQWRVLRVLEEFGELDSTRLAQKACLLMPSQSRIVQTLTDKGFVSRTADSVDRRRQTVALLPPGRQFLVDKLKESRAIADRIEKQLGKKRLQTLLNILEDLKEFR